MALSHTLKSLNSEAYILYEPKRTNLVPITQSFDTQLAIPTRISLAFRFHFCLSIKWVPYGYVVEAWWFQ